MTTPDAGPAGEPVWWLALCLQCTPLLPQPFSGDAAGLSSRDAWASAHNAGTGHLVVLARGDTPGSRELASALRAFLAGARA